MGMSLIADVINMEKIKNILYSSYKEELNNLSLGYNYNSRNLDKMLELIQTIFFLELGEPSGEDLLKLLKHYEYN